MPHLPRESKVDVTKCHACHAKCHGVTGDKSGPSAPPSTICPTPATQNECVCVCVCLDKECVKLYVDKMCVDKECVDKECVDKVCVDKECVDKECVTKCVCDFVPHLPRESKVDVTKCHACHVNRRWMSPSATPAT